MTQHTEHKKHSEHKHHEHHGGKAEQPENRAVGEFVNPGEEVKHHPPIGGPGGEKTMPIGTPIRSITDESQEEES